jgi:hypothetical protein
MMRLDVDFSRALSQDEQVSALVALSTLTKAQKVRFIHSARTAVVLAEGLSARRVQETLVEAGLAVERVSTSLDAEIDLLCDDLEQGGDQRERFRAIGR